MMKRVILFLTLLATFPALSLAAEPSGDQAVKKARQQVEEAITKGEASLGPHQPGSGWTKNHMRQVLALIEGEGGSSGAISLLKQAQAGLSQDAAAAVHAALLYLQAATEHAKRAVSAKSIDETHDEATLATGLLVAAQGNAGAKSPITRALAAVK